MINANPPPAVRCIAEVWRFRRILLIVNGASALVAIGYVLIAPVMFEATAVLVIPSDAIEYGGRAARPEVRPAAIVGRLISRAHARDVVSISGLGDKEGRNLPRNYLIERNDDRKGEIIRLRYRNSDPHRAAAVLDASISALERWRAGEQAATSKDVARRCESQFDSASAELRVAAELLVAYRQGAGLFAPEHQAAASDAVARQLDALGESLRIDVSRVGAAHPLEELRRARLGAAADVRNELRSRGGGVLLVDSERSQRSTEHLRLEQRYRLAVERRDRWEEALLSSQADIARCPPLPILQRALVPDKRVEPRRRMLAISWTGVVASFSLSAVCAVALVKPCSLRA